MSPSRKSIAIFASVHPWTSVNNFKRCYTALLLQYPFVLCYTAVDVWNNTGSLVQLYCVFVLQSHRAWLHELSHSPTHNITLLQTLSHWHTGTVLLRILSFCFTDTLVPSWHTVFLSHWHNVFLSYYCLSMLPTHCHKSCWHTYCLSVSLIIDIVSYYLTDILSFSLTNCRCSGRLR